MQLPHGNNATKQITDLSEILSAPLKVSGGRVACQEDSEWALVFHQ
jgi:hypothetical protein